MENLYTPNCIRTFTGIYVNIFEPTEDMFCIEDIAHALAHQCRFGGHLPRFYSVAQHSVESMRHVPNSMAYDMLMHDASEAYLLDLPKPIKLNMPQYNEIEDYMMAVLAKKFCFTYPMTKVMHAADKKQLEIEWNGIMLNKNPEHTCLDSKAAKDLFLNLYKSLTRIPLSPEFVFPNPL